MKMSVFSGALGFLIAQLPAKKSVKNLTCFIEKHYVDDKDQQWNLFSEISTNTMQGMSNSFLA